MTHSLEQNWRNNDPATSEEAGRAAWMFLADHQRAIMQVLSHSAQALAAEQIADRLGWSSHHAVNRRLPELLDRGLVERTAELHTNRSGRSAYRYRVAA